MRVQAVAALLMLTAGLAGCLADSDDLEGAGLDPTELLAKPWIDNWSLQSASFEITYDPAEEHVEAQGTLTILNELGEDRGSLQLFMEPFEITSITDEAGNELEYEVVETPSPFAGVPVLGFFSNFQTVEVQLTGETGHGALREVHMAHEGWADQDTANPAEVPNDFAAHTQLGIIPIVDGNADTEMAFNLTTPEGSVVLPSAAVVSESTEEGWTTTAYQVRSGYVIFFSGDGLLWLEDEVDGVEVRTYYYPDMGVQAQTTHDLTKRIIPVVENLTGPYPYDHLWTVPHEVAVNAFSTPGLTFMGLNFYRTTVPHVPVQFGRLTPYAGGSDMFEMVVVHEHTHNWWGHNVEGNNSDPEAGPRDTWITEGITTYLSEMVWFEEQYGDGDAAASSNGKVVDQRVRNADSPGEEEPGVTEPGGDYYEKGALSLRALQAYAEATEREGLVLETLREGQDRFGLLQGGQGTVTTDEMIALFEDVFQEELDWHFEPWFFSGQLADLTISSVEAEEATVAVDITNLGEVQAAALVHVESLSGQRLEGWTVVPPGETSTLEIERPAPAAGDPVVRAQVDPLQHIYESNERNNRWVS